MTPGRKKLAIRIGAGVVIFAAIVGVFVIAGDLPIIAVGLVALGLLIVIALKIRANRKTKVIFGFYVAANEILVDGDKSRYHFEIAQVIKTGERIVRSMPDSPPLSRFALGALYYSIGDHNAAVEQLGFAAAEEVLKESRHATPARQFRPYRPQPPGLRPRPKTF